MDYSELLKGGIPDPEQLKGYGFIEDGPSLVLKKDLSDPDLHMLVRIVDHSVDVRVIDSAFGEDYLPFGIKNRPCAIRDEAEEILDDIVFQCFTRQTPAKLAARYMEETYGVRHENPWKKYPEYCTFKAPVSKKWFAVLMNIPENCIGLEGSKTVDIINLKGQPDRIKELIDNRHFFPAYHMIA